MKKALLITFTVLSISSVASSVEDKSGDVIFEIQNHNEKSR